jgi:hypothetical protein
MELNDSHMYIAHTLQLTQAISVLRYYATKVGSQSATASRLAFIASEVERFRDEEFGELADDFSVVSASSRERARDSLGFVRAAEPETLRSTLARAWEKVSSVFTLMPKMALATVAAAALLLIIILPRGEPPEQILGLSSEQWKAPDMRLMGPRPIPKTPYMKKAPEGEKTLLVILIYFRNFPRPIDQKMIDDAYQAARPTRAIDRRFDVVRPDEVKVAVEKERIDTRNVTETAKGLQSSLKVQEALIVTISARGESIDIECRLTNAGTGEVIRAKTQSSVPEKELMSVLRNSILELLAG